MTPLHRQGIIEINFKRIVLAATDYGYLRI